MLTEAKARLREETLARLKRIPKSHRTTESAQICARLNASEMWRTADLVLTFAPHVTEPDIWPVLIETLAEGKRIALPSYDFEQREYCAREIRNIQADVITGRYGIREPRPECPKAPLNQLDLVLVPGVAFDSRGRRLGRGKGFYDRLLALCSGVKCGVAYDEQVVAEVPAEPHDVVLNRILTPTRWL